MKIGVLQTGKVAPELVARFGEYPPMFAALYRSVEPSLGLEGFAVVDGELPESAAACDAWLITGSKFGVYDPEPWIEPLKDFLREARAARVPIIGICFGHQIMAEAFGGRAEKSQKGWGVGAHGYEVIARPGWLAEAGGNFAMHAMHQDQVTAVPGDATCLATSEFCEYAMLSYGDPERPDAISIQAHPEFDRDLAEAIVALRTGVLIPEEIAAVARASFGTPVANTDFVRWSLAYLDRVRAGRAAA